MKKIIIPGGSGFLGQSLAAYLSTEGYEIVILSRKASPSANNISYQVWDGENLGEWAKSFEGAEAIINLAGRTVNCRYTPQNKQEIYDSRLKSTAIIGEAIKQCTEAPKLWMNSSSATIYRHALDRPMDEETGEYGEGFSVNVCQKWEKTFNEIKLPHTRKIALRMSIVLGKEGGAMQPLNNLVKFGLGGTQGKGNQYMSWIHEKDLHEMFLWMIKNEDLEGAFNCAAPNPITNQYFLKTLRKAHKQSIGLPATKWMLEIGAWMIGTETELILKSRRVIPKRAIDKGFEFKFSHIEEALQDLVAK
jgi:hypothetical protein